MNPYPGSDICPVCTGGQFRQVEGRDLLYGLPGVFRYFQCLACSCVFLADRIADLSACYPSRYYSYASAPPPKRDSAWVAWLKACRTTYALGGNMRLGRALNALKPAAPLYFSLARAGINVNSRVLEVGCGSGTLLAGMRRDGFRNLTGIDRFLPTQAAREETGLKILSGDVTALCERESNAYDLIMLHHTLEHMYNHAEMLGTLRSLLAPAGALFVSMPMVGYGWRQYGPHWSNLDAPRHLLIHSDTSFRMLYEKAGFEELASEHNSTAYFLIISEQNKHGTDYWGPNSYQTDPRNTPFNDRQLQEFATLTDKLNRKRDADSAWFLLRKQ